MKNFYVDLHIHIGRTKTGRPVKITGAKSLTIENILKQASFIKGMDMIGVIDCHVPEILEELRQLIKDGKLYSLQGGGLRYEQVTLILGTEIEVYDHNCQGPLHVLAYFPTIDVMAQFSKWLSERITNITLSTQRIYETAENLQMKVKQLAGLFIPAHVFTPFKSLYGSGVKKSLTEVLNPELIDAIELGLSSDTEMADQLQELHPFSFVSNSDAHSLGKIAREYQVMQMKEPSFAELELALHHEDGRYIIANFGLNPRLGKYHRTTCEKCLTLITDEAVCPNCGHNRTTTGVYERIEQLKQAQQPVDGSGKKVDRPPYHHQIPLEFIPKLGPKTLAKLRDYFGTEMNIIHHVPEQELRKITTSAIADYILLARAGKLDLTAGGGGRYGKVTGNDNNKE